MKAKFLGIVAACFLLSGCNLWLGAALGIGAAAGYYLGSDKRSMGQMGTDTAISSDINATLYSVPGVSPYKVTVFTRDQCVILDGKVSSQEASNRVTQIAKNTQGVKSVQNNLRIESPFN